MAPTGIPSLRLYGLPIPHNARQTPPSSSSPVPSPLPTPFSGESTSTAEQSFTHPTIAMPEPGPAHYEARRALWLTPPSSPPRVPSPSTSRAKLELLLSREDALHNDVVWNSGLKSVWKGLVGGGRLRRRLPLGMVIRILQTGWLRDGTWPAEVTTNPPSPLPPVPLVKVPNETSKGGRGDGQNDIMKKI